MTASVETRPPVPLDRHPSSRPDPSRDGRPEREDLTLLALRAKEGGVQEMNSLFSLTRDHVARFIAGRVDPSWVDDLTQETFSRAMRGLARYEGRAPVRSWLLSVARHTVADRYRSHGRAPRHESVDDWSRVGPGAAPGRFDEYLALLDLLRELPEDRRRAFVLTQIEGVPYAEAARSIGVPIGTVRSRVARGRRDLLRLLREAA
ncbi:sigma-70 family RNA polymerase sigma factor [Nocardiopsis sp. FIRDI 009]|uniref:sigma-70 family RNA polymerase sigma factor n=1 Tax=Nocardiopsis sp. FIRDI 009 TaxID=714197 RepID=UPI001E4FAB07|nr:sigma-70 family RNA polymerase sigma factor [Nocardiopsis sp. FIRDI 009]